MAAARSIGLVMVPVLVAVMVRSGAGGNCPEAERTERGPNPPQPGAERRPAGKDVGPAQRAPLAKEPACPVGMVRIPAGTFGMGSSNRTPLSLDERPRHEVTLSGYCIDKLEVTVKEYAACVAAKGCSAAPRTVNWSGSSTETVKRVSQLCNQDDRPDHPINCVDWHQATAYCRWAGKRLPTEAEWEYAARGADGRIYPWGNDPPSERHMNACGTECASIKERVMQSSVSQMYTARDGWGTTAPGGSFPGDASPFGVLDLAGNVREWTADRYGDYSGAVVTNPLGAQTGWARVTRGGHWGSSNTTFDGRAAGRDQEEPEVRDVDLGFRCVRMD